jgi:predicted dehydrogenase
MAPAIRYARALIASGYVGDVLATTIVGSGIGWGGVTDEAHAYVYDLKNGATTTSVPLMHAIDAMTFVLGDIAEIQAMSEIRRPFVTVSESNSTRPVSAPDHVAVSAKLHGGVLASVFYRGGVSRGDNFRWEINGTLGDLVLTSTVGNLQVVDPVLAGARGDASEVEVLSVPAEYELAAKAPSGPAANVARLYAAFLRDLKEGNAGALAPDFCHAEHQHAWLSVIEAGSQRAGCV